ncbi:hypothetical protein [Streptomyces sp. NPDC094031]|uniref:hypothetical protein n=1 Tax=Streptomyces sp. NPDC094031 TaxID=3155307 RepID=UPI003321EC96
MPAEKGHEPAGFAEVPDAEGRPAVVRGSGGDAGSDVALGQVHLEISGMAAPTRLKVRPRGLTTLDRNPRLQEEPARGVDGSISG